MWVSIPSRGFWFFEVTQPALAFASSALIAFQSPRGDFGFLKLAFRLILRGLRCSEVSIPSRGFWFFEDEGRKRSECFEHVSFNPLAGILVF